MASASTVFISYSWESEEHSDKVLALADTLEMKGLTVIFDQYEPFPSKPWPQWMRDGLVEAEFVLCICTQSYYDRWHGKQEVGTGLGCQWEGTIMANVGAKFPEKLCKFIPILIPPTNIGTIPEEISGNNRFTLNQFDTKNPEFKRLYLLLTHQELTPRPPRGEIEIFQPKIRSSLPRSGRVESLDIAKVSKKLNTPDKTTKLSKVSKSDFRGRGSFAKRKATALVQAGHRAYTREEYREATDLYLSAHRLCGDIGALAEAGETLFYSGEKEEASKYLQEALLLNPNDGNTQGLLARIECVDPSEELAVVEKLLIKYPGNYDLSLQHASLLIDLERNDDARRFLENLWDDSKDPNIAASLKNVFENLGNHGQAETWAAKVVKQAPEAPIAWVIYGEALAHNKRIGLALEAFRTALKMAPRYSHAIWDIGACYALMGEAQQCVIYLRQAILIDAKHFGKAALNEFDAIRESSEFQQFVAEGAPAI